MNEDWTFWLMMTNLALALVVLLSAAAVVVAVVWEFMAAKGRKVPAMSGIDAELSAMLREEAERILMGESDAAAGEDEKVRLRKSRRN